MDRPNMIPVEVHRGETGCLGGIGLVVLRMRLGVFGGLGIKVLKVVLVQVNVHVRIFISEIDRTGRTASSRARVRTVVRRVLFIRRLEQCLSARVVRLGRRNVVVFLL
jgi:hypothetical protein